MNTLKIYILSILLLVPLLVDAQVKSGRLGNGKYVVSTGDTTKIVMQRGLKSPYSKFLFDAPRELIDSLYAESGDHLSTTEAIRDVSSKLDKIERDQGILEAGNSSLSYRLSTEYIAANKKEKSARAYADSLLLARNKETEETLALNFLIYGDKSSYYVNGLQVSPQITTMLEPGDVVSRTVKTNTPNPNGEVWLTLTDKALRRLKLPIPGVGQDDEVSNYPQVYDMRETQQDEDSRKQKESVSKATIKENSDTYYYYEPDPKAKPKKTVKGRKRY